MTGVRTSLATILLLSFLVPASLSAAGKEDQTEFATSLFRTTMMNGKPWITLDLQSRIMYLVGLDDGAGLLIAEIVSDLNEKVVASAALAAKERLTIKGFRFSDIVEEIDQFYAEASNRRIPVVDAYRYALRKFQGASPEELAAAKSALRKKYNR